MSSPKKVPYYTMESSLNPLAKKGWKLYYGNQGCVPLNTQKSVSMERLAPGEPSKPKPPQATPEQIKAQKAEEARQQQLAAQAKKQAQKNAKNASVPAAEEPPGEECENPPVFDMLDIPDAMDKLKWPVSAKFARKWFGSPKHVFDGDLNSVQPIDDTTVTLDWVFKFGSVKEIFHELLAEGIYSDKAIPKAKEIVSWKAKEIFAKGNSMNLSFDTKPFLGDLRQFHIDWHFQHAPIKDWNTLSGLRTMNDLTGSLANFNIYVAIGNVLITGDKYYKYDSKAGAKTYCLEPKVQITHVYVYIKDNYSFRDEKGEKSQYLGHWNKTGVIVTNGGIIGKLRNSDNDDSPRSESWYDIISNGLDKPVDTRKSAFGKHKEKDVYFPIYNKSYNEWRDRHNRGGDFMVYSKPKYMKLKKPIEFSLETLCRPPEKM